ncbi:ATPase, T2SS/T4P/T4SS family [Marinobacterium mangrovicola]|uniref:Pilus assembly protein CpaF n=1 Tax=Marinobacterium mangrovicola TaxID=1476959 RepID=A0A4R1GAA4_9GAMM|nr:ATPase, T2SS/T4P/T4SS family [Marinobacterium mangrovicola]TCK03631.1 pilus assembly protein CpaF [Marinobacterium mangrovicola]
MFTLEIRVATEEPQTRELDPGVYKIGRSIWSDIRIKSGQLLKHHMTLAVQEDGFKLVALGDLEVNGRRAQSLITPESGTCCRMGDVELVFTHAFKTAEELLDESDSRFENTESASSVKLDIPASPSAASQASEPSPDEIEDSRIWTATKKALQKAILEKLDLYKRGIIDGLNDEDLRAEATDTAQSIIAGKQIEIPAHLNKRQLIQETVAESIGLGPLEPLLADNTVSEVMVNGPNQIYLERNGKIERSTTRFTGDNSLLSVIERIVSPLGRRIDEGSPMVDARLKDGSRVNAIIPPLSLIGPVVTIRKFSAEKYNLDKLVGFGSLNTEMARFLEICVRHRKNIVVCGGTGSGKTTFLNALSDCIPHFERIITIEDAAELQLAQDHVISLESRPANVEKTGEITIRDLVKNSLRMRPDRIIVGECRGAEALDMLQAMNTGHEGSMTTAHSNSPRDLLSRLEVMVLMSGMDLPVRVIREQIASAVDIIVHQSRFSDGRRRVTSIVEVDGMEEDIVLMQKLFEFRQSSIDSEGRLHGEFKSLGIAPRFYTELQEAGVELDRSIFMSGSKEPSTS